jgi:hypothetical protein
MLQHLHFLLLPLQLALHELLVKARLTKPRPGRSALPPRRAYRESVFLTLLVVLDAAAAAYPYADRITTRSFLPAVVDVDLGHEVLPRWLVVHDVVLIPVAAVFFVNIVVVVVVVLSFIIIIVRSGSARLLRFRLLGQTLKL